MAPLNKIYFEHPFIKIMGCTLYTRVLLFLIKHNDKPFNKLDLCNYTKIKKNTADLYLRNLHKYSIICVVEKTKETITIKEVDNIENKRYNTLFIINKENEIVKQINELIEWCEKLENVKVVEKQQNIIEKDVKLVIKN